VIISVLVPPIRVPRRLTTGLLINLLIFFAQRTKLRTQQVVKSRGQHCGDIELVGYLTNAPVPEPLVLDLHIPHDRVVSSADPALNGHVRYPNNLDQSLNDAGTDKLRKYHTYYNFNPPRGVGFMSAIVSTSGRLHSEFIRIYSYRLIGKLTAFLQLQEFCHHNQTVDFSTTSVRLFLLCSNLGLEIFSPRLQLYVLTSTLTDRQSRLSLTLTLHTHKLLSPILIYKSSFYPSLY
jgi:hypothetical protein